MFLTSLTLEGESLPDGYPFTVPCIQALSTLAFDAPVTIFCRREWIGEIDAAGGDSLRNEVPRHRFLGPFEGPNARGCPADWRSNYAWPGLTTPKVKLFFRAEDAIGFTRRMTENITATWRS